VRVIAQSKLAFQSQQIKVEIKSQVIDVPKFQAILLLQETIKESSSAPKREGL